MTSLPLAAAIAALGATGASAAHLDYFSATVTPLNGSGASARASVGLVAALAAPLRFTAPALDDVDAFLQEVASAPRRAC